MISERVQATRLAARSGNTLNWVLTRCLVTAPWNIDCHQCRDACPEAALSVISSDQGGLLSASDHCTQCLDCVSACDTEALIPLSATLSRRELFKRLASPMVPSVAITDAAPAPRKRWREEATKANANEPVLHPHVLLNADRCDTSGLCSQLCPSAALQADASGTLRFDSALCLGCGQCERLCPTQAITLEQGHSPNSGAIRQTEQRQCSDCAHTYQDVIGTAAEADDWDRLPLCPACQRNQSLMKNDVLSLYR